MKRGLRGWILGLAACWLGCGASQDAVDLEQEATLENCRQLAPPEGTDRSVAARQVTSQAVTSQVVPIVLVPAGSQALSTVELNTVRQALSNVRRWYERELPNRNLNWAPIQVMQGAQSASYYLTNNNVWNDIPGEIQGQFGWNPWAYTGGAHRIALVMGRDLLGWAGANGYTDGRGLAIVGLESLLELSKCSGNWWCTQEFWHGTVAHELGHTFTLPHDTVADSIMSFHDAYTTRHFTATAATTVEANPATLPKKANWDYCSIDYECATKRCGGNYSGDRLWCLPTPAYPKQAQNIPATFTCREHSQCLTGICTFSPASGAKVCASSATPNYVTPFFPDVP
ncbi:zinc metalloprotease [Corallococcus exiguus]|uniref:Peptidase M12B domain-containing protein n=1 Tax=Corallococcus exiguus TaxID=83462 RepID=A0A7X4YCB2_9BACT|nr:hypothetical protein [Corallococcus exiguus]NBC42845.1 hypothetical protein [Corallococcus exiguus]TNV66538.1 hypothetical protein FH620_05705 [Corallococcus exiguus]